MGSTYDWQIPGARMEIYDEIFLPAFIADWSPRLADRVSLKSADRVLDVACGSGAWALCAANRLGMDGQVVGMDISHDMLAIARRKTAAGLPLAVDWIEGSADAIPCADAAFDVVCCQLGMMFFPDKVAALNEMRRVLVPGGRLIVLVWGRMEKCPGQMAVVAAWTHVFGADAAAGFHRQHSLADVGEVGALFAAAGFQDTAATWEMGEVRFATPAHLARSYGALMGLEVEPAVAEALIADVDASLAGYMGPDGLVYPIEAVVATGCRPA